MSFTMPDFRRITSEESSPLNNMVSNAMKQYSNAINLRYKPRMAEADILAKQLGPLAALATSPMGVGLAGPQGDQARELLSKILQQSQAANNPQQHHGLMQRLSQMFGGQQQSEGGMPQQPAMGDVNSQQGGSLADQVRSRALQGITKEQVPAGTVYGTEGAERLSPSGELRSQTESAIAGGKRTNDAISGILGEINKIKRSTGITGLAKKAALGLEGTNLPYISNIAGAVVPKELTVKQRELENSLINNWKYDQETAHAVSQKSANESLEDYAHRIAKLKQELSKHGKRLSKYSASGIPLTGEQEEAVQPTGVSETKEPVGSAQFYRHNGNLIKVNSNKLKAFLKKFPDATPDQGY